jgi:hypothetical protein
MIEYNARELSNLLCCEPKWKPIYKLMSQMNVEELKQFRKDLREYTPYHYLHKNLEREFRNSIGD